MEHRHCKRLEREKKTIEVMINLYCKDHHSPITDLCEGCETLFHYSMKRIELCKHKLNKPVCSKCRSHCFNPKMKEQVKRVMRYSGPKMIKKHPLLAILHMIDSMRSI